MELLPGTLNTRVVYMEIYLYIHTHICMHTYIHTLISTTKLTENEEPFLITSLSQPPTAELAILQREVHQYKMKKNPTANQSVVAALASETPLRLQSQPPSSRTTKIHPGLLLATASPTLGTTRRGST